MKNYTMTRKNNPQQENAYILYMIIGSCFAKVYCRSKLMEDKLYLCYTEMKRERQESREEQIITQTEHKLGAYLEVLGKMNCEVHITRRNNDYYLDFYTGFENIRVRVDSQGRYTLSVDVEECISKRSA